MTDAAALAGAISSLQVAFNLAKSLIGLRDASVIQSKVLELQGIILAAQEGALSAQRRESAMLERVHLLEQEVADLKAWDAEKQRYQLKDIRPPGTSAGSALVYVLKEDAGTSEPTHMLCPNCYQKNQKSILQEEIRDSRVRIIFCHPCGLEISRSGRWHDGLVERGSESRPRR